MSRSLPEFPEGCRVFYNLLGPDSRPIQYDGLNVRSLRIMDNIFHLYNVEDKLVARLPACNVLCILPLETVSVSESKQ
jgi:hypothetical protein